MADDRYECLGELGRGVFGVVYRARQVHLDRECALKLLHVRTDVSSVLEEARRLAGLPEHENVVKVLDAGRWDENTVFIASELCGGGSLEDLCRAGPLDPTTACRWIAEACRGLAHLHHHELLHLDVRPANILMSGGSPRLVDFGLARWTHDAEVHDWYGPHAAPELVETGAATEATDIYAMAMSLAHLLTGGNICHPFPDGANLVQASADGEWPRLNELGEHVPPRLRKLVREATTYTVGDRPQTVDEFKQRLDKATPAVAFMVEQEGFLISADGAWSIAILESSGGCDVEVRRNGRQRRTLGAAGVTAPRARAHVAKLLGQFADGKL